MEKRFYFFLLAALLVLATSCQNGFQEESVNAVGFDDFMAKSVQTAVNPEDGTTHYLIENCIRTTDYDFVKSYYNSMNDQSRGTAHLIDGSWDMWSGSEVANLTYTISSNFSSSEEDVIRYYMNRATADWEALYGSNINFTEVSSGGVFQVRPSVWWENWLYNGVIASAFFPHEGTRDLVVYDVFFNERIVTSWPVTEEVEKTFVLSHELGHALGMRHEFIWENGVQVKETSAPAELVTAWDPASIMFYPQFDEYTGDGSITSLDEEMMDIYY